MLHHACYAYVCPCSCVRVYLYHMVYIYIYIYMHMHTHTHTHNTRVHTYMYMYTYDVYIYIHTCIYTYTRICLSSRYRDIFINHRKGGTTPPNTYIEPRTPLSLLEDFRYFPYTNLIDASK